MGATEVIAVELDSLGIRRSVKDKTFLIDKDTDFGPYTTYGINTGETYRQAMGLYNDACVVEESAERTHIVFHLVCQFLPVTACCSLDASDASCHACLRENLEGTDCICVGSVSTATKFC